MTDETKTNINEETIQKLQDMRRANAAIGACVDILNENRVNQGSIPSGSRVFIHLDPNQEAGLLFAIEACTKKISNEFDDYLEEMGVYWLDEFSPDLNRQAQAVDKLQNGEISFSEFKKNTGLPDSLQ